MFRHEAGSTQYGLSQARSGRFKETWDQPYKYIAVFDGFNTNVNDPVFIYRVKNDLIIACMWLEQMRRRNDVSSNST